jgi:MFS transporter, ACDE family, multidrug resistance protein
VSSSRGAARPGALLNQPGSVWATAFAAAVAFMGIGLVDPILPSIARGLNASPWQVEMLFTSYIVVMAGAMFLTGMVATRIGAKKTMLAGLLLVIVFSALSGLSGSIAMLAGMRGGWGLGNALFVATALSIIVGAAAGGLGNAITLYEAALGLGISSGPLLGAALGSMSWRYPFFGTAALMAVAFILTSTLVRESGMPEQRGSARDTLRALKDPGLLTLAMGGLLYSFGFFVLLAYTPLLLGISAREIGLIFFGWGILVAITSVFVAPWLRARYGPTHVVLGVLVLFALDLALMTTGPRSILPATVIASGALLGVNNALFTSLAMEVSTVTRSVASAGYNFLRWAGAAAAPVLSGFLAVAVSPRFPFLLAALSVAGSAALIWVRRAHVTHGLRHSSAAHAEAA